VRRAAREAHVSISKWVVDRLSQSIEMSLPAEFLILAGAFPDFPSAEAPRQGYGQDVSQDNAD
jgi:hypothetical protein